MFIWGHRGCRGIDGFDENTLIACQWAINHGVDGLEFDVQVSDDGVPFVFHDPTLTRLGADSDSRLVESLDWDMIQQLTLKNGGRIPRLEEMLPFASTVRMNLEIKTRRAVPSVLNVLKDVNRNDWIVSSFEYESLLAVRSAFPDLELGYLLERHVDESLSDCLDRAFAQVKTLHPQRIHLDDALCDASAINKLAGLGLPIHVWTVNDLARANFLSRHGVAGLFTDNARLFES